MKGRYPWTSNFYGIYYTMTGLHGVHVVGGMVVTAYLIGPGRKMWRSEPERFTGRIEITGLYWHFVDLVWIFLFPVFYLL
jgi:heme/copper-type cytochrome/quinol oxidase subunit 3